MQNSIRLSPNMLITYSKDVTKMVEHVFLLSLGYFLSLSPDSTHLYTSDMGNLYFFKINMKINPTKTVIKLNLTHVRVQINRFYLGHQTCNLELELK